MEGILHHLECIKPCNGWDKLPTATGEFTGFSEPSTVWRDPGSLDHEITSLLLNKKNKYTPRKTNMEPENEPLEEEIPIRNHHFPAPC